MALKPNKLTLEQQIERMLERAESANKRSKRCRDEINKMVWLSVASNYNDVAESLIELRNLKKGI